MISIFNLTKEFIENLREEDIMIDLNEALDEDKEFF